MLIPLVLMDVVEALDGNIGDEAGDFLDTHIFRMAIRIDSHMKLYFWSLRCNFSRIV